MSMQKYGEMLRKDVCETCGGEGKVFNFDRVPTDYGDHVVFDLKTCEVCGGTGRLDVIDRVNFGLREAVRRSFRSSRFRGVVGLLVISASSAPLFLSTLLTTSSAAPVAPVAVVDSGLTCSALVAKFERLGYRPGGAVPTAAKVLYFPATGQKNVYAVFTNSTEPQFSKTLGFWRCRL